MNPSYDLGSAPLQHATWTDLALGLGLAGAAAVLLASLIVLAARLTETRSTRTQPTDTPQVTQATTRASTRATTSARKSGRTSR